MDEAMSPTRALTIAIKAILDEDVARGYHLPDPQVHLTVEALRLAQRILEHLPAGWVVMDRALVDELSNRVGESEGAIKLLLAIRLQQDGHAKTWPEALRLADNRAKVRELYPQVPE